MESVGTYLKQERLRNNINLETISLELKISHSILKDIEDDKLPNYMDKVFIIGHIRSYAMYLNLDCKEVIENFKLQLSFDNNKDKDEIKKLIKIFNIFSLYKPVSFVSIILITCSFYVLFIYPNNLEPKYAITPDIPENLQSAVEEFEMNIILSKKNDKDENRNIQLIKDNNQISSSSAIASLPKNNSSKIIKDKITLKFLDSTWIQIRNLNDQIIFSKLMYKNEEYIYSIKDNYNLTSGNAGNIMVLIDDKVLGKAGKSGEVVESLIIDNKFNN